MLGDEPQQKAVLALDNPAARRGDALFIAEVFILAHQQKPPWGRGAVGSPGVPRRPRGARKRNDARAERSRSPCREESAQRSLSPFPRGFASAANKTIAASSNTSACSG